MWQQLPSNQGHQPDMRRLYGKDGCCRISHNNSDNGRVRVDRHFYMYTFNKEHYNAIRLPFLPIRTRYRRSPLRGNGRVQNLRMVQSCGHIRKVERWRRSHKRPPPSFPVSNLSYAQVVLKLLAIVWQSKYTISIKINEPQRWYCHADIWLLPHFHATAKYRTASP